MNFSLISGAEAFAFAGAFDFIRETGTSGGQTAAEIICGKLEALGLQPTVEEFPITRHYVEKAIFKVTAPYEKEYTVCGLRNSCSTPQSGIRSEFLFAEEGDDITLSRAAGKILLLSHRPGGAEYQKLTQAGAAGLLCVCGTPIDQGENRLPQTGKLQITPFPTLPAVYIHHQDARELVEQGASEAELYLGLGEEAATARNVTVRVPGTEHPGEIIALTAHFDSVPEGPGAYDNLSGAAIIFELCRYFARHPAKRTMEFTFFDAEEIGCKGSTDFLRRRKAQWENYLLNLNVDLAGQTIGGTVLGVTADRSLLDSLNDRLWECGIGAKLRQDVWSGDANVFAACGIPAVTLDRDGFGMHTRNDTLDLISPWALERDARLLAYLADFYSNCDALSFARSVPESMVQQLRTRYRI